MEYMSRLRPMKVARLTAARRIRAGEQNLTRAAAGDCGPVGRFEDEGEEEEEVVEKDGLGMRSSSSHQTMAGA